VKNVRNLMFQIAKKKKRDGGLIITGEKEGEGEGYLLHPVENVAVIDHLLGWAERRRHDRESKEEHQMFCLGRENEKEENDLPRDSAGRKKNCAP